MIKTESAGGVVIGPNDKVLIVSQHGTSWSLPKGMLEDGEDHRAAALREIEEETGLTKLNFVLGLGTYQRHKISLDGGDDPSELKTITMFLYTTPESALKPIDPDNPEARWVEPEKVSELLTHAKDKSFYESVQDEVMQAISSRLGE